MHKQNDLAKLLLRLGFGGFMLVHGVPKLMKLLEGGPYEFADPIGLGPTISLILTVFAEVVCSILIVIGYKTKWAVIPLIITMLVAALVVHWPHPWNKKELGLLFAIGYIVIGLLGSGKYSIDRK